MADCTALKDRLDALNAARDRILTGGAVRVIVDSDGSRVEYTATRLSDLLQEIIRAQAAYDACAGVTAVLTRPLTFVFR